MPTIHHDYARVPADEAKYGKGRTLNTLPVEMFDAFDPTVLGLGDITTEGRYVQALAAVFDLEGFTAFCNQVDSHLVVPEFLVQYLKWMFSEIRSKFREGAEGKRVRVWGSLPFFVKFLGDGLLLLWDTDRSGGPSGVRNIVARLLRITRAYPEAFLPGIRANFTNPPRKLRCGAARGQVISVGSDGDYVGSCINIAARLQKLPGLTFAVSRRGIDTAEVLDLPGWKNFIVRRIQLRGIGDDELVYVHSEELEKLKAKDRKFYRD